MEKEEWINNRTADPNKIGKLWWNKMYNQCHLPFGEIKDPVPQDIEKKMMCEFLQRQQQTPEDIANWMDNLGTRGIIRGIFSDVDGKTANGTPETLKTILDMAYKVSTKDQKQTTNNSNIPSNLYEM